MRPPLERRHRRAASGNNLQQMDHKGSRPLGPPFSSVVPCSETANSGPIHRTYRTDLSPALGIFGCLTAYEAFRRGLTVGPTNPCLGYRPIDDAGVPGPYLFHTYAEVADMVDQLAGGIQRENLMPPTADNLRLLGIFLKNCPEWVIAEHACFALGGTTVPMYDTHRLDTIAAIINQTELQTLVCGQDDTLKVLGLVGSCSTLRTIIQVQAVSADLRAKARGAGVVLLSFADVMRIGRAYPCTHTPPAPKNVHTFCYTSGTSGQPKGALLSHENFLVSVASMCIPDLHLSHDDVYLSYLPLPHVYERLMQIALFVHGASIGFFHGNSAKLMEDVVALRPTIFATVPRVLNRIHDKIMSGVQSTKSLKSTLFLAGYRAKMANLQQHGQFAHSVWDRLIFNKIAVALGLDRCRVMTSGAAPLSKHIMDFYRILLPHTMVFEGYGQTESSGIISVTAYEDLGAGHVGSPQPAVEIKLVDVPEMGYSHRDVVHGDPSTGSAITCQGRGEICIRGPNVFLGYYKQPQQTAEVLDPDGWLHTGDIGLWTQLGQLMIIDRKSNISKLSQGEFIAAEMIENNHLQCPLVAQSFTYGDPTATYVVAVIVPDEDEARIWAAQCNLADKSIAELCDLPEFKFAVLQQIVEHGYSAGLRGFEIVRNIKLEPVPFSVENGLLTPTFKLKRGPAREHYRETLASLYREGPAQIPSRL